mgnify:CR=1 FL=1
MGNLSNITHIYVQGTDNEVGITQSNQELSIMGGMELNFTRPYKLHIWKKLGFLGFYLGTTLLLKEKKQQSRRQLII